VLLVTNAANAFGGGLVLPFLWIYLSQVRHLPEWVPAATLAAQAIAAVIGGLFWGAELDRVPYRAVVPQVMLVAGVGTAMYAAATSAPLAIFAGVVYGVGISGVGTMLRSVYAVTTSGEQRGLTYSLDFAILNAMAGVGVVVGGVIATASFASPVTRYAVLYLGDGFTFVLTGAVATALLWRSPLKREPAPRGGKQRGGYLAVLKDRRLLGVYAVLLMALVVSYGQYKAGLPGYLLARHVMGAAGLSFITAFNIVAVVVVQFLGMPFLRQIPSTRLLALSGAAFAAGWICIAVAGQQHGLATLTAAVIAMAFLSTGEVLVIPVANTLVNNLVADRLRGRANALLSITTSTSSTLGPAIAGATLPFAGGEILLIVLIAGSVVALALGLRLGALVPAGANSDVKQPDGAVLQASS